MDINEEGNGSKEVNWEEKCGKNGQWSLSWVGNKMNAENKMNAGEAKSWASRE